MKKICFPVSSARILLLSLALIVSIRVSAVGFTPTDCGLVVNLKPGDRILLSTMIDDDNNPATPMTEYFVCDYAGHTGGYFSYKAGNTLKLIPQAADATEASEASVWTIDTALTHPKGQEFGGISYTMWGNEGHTILLAGNFKTQGALSSNLNEKNLADVVFVIPTKFDNITSLDPKKTLSRGDQDAQGRFNGATGTGFLGMTYREVFFLDIPRSHEPSYTNASVVGFNTTQSDYKYSNNAETAKPGQALYSFADEKHKPTKRTLFRLYILNEPIQSCPESYFFAYDEQDYTRYRKYSGDSTALGKVYTMDRLFCMEQEGESSVYKTDLMRVPESDSAYYYVGYRNKYRNSTDDLQLGSGSAISQFTNIRQLRVRALAGESTAYTAPAGACGRMVADTTSNRNNLNVTFEPAGYFLRTSSGLNVRMTRGADGKWTSEEMWTISGAYAEMSIKATLFTGPEFSESDPGADIADWSEMTLGSEVPVEGGGSVVDQSGWARIDPSNAGKNGGLVFIRANKTRHIHYDNNGYLGSRIPDQYPVAGETRVTVSEARLVSGYTFLGWTTNADGTGTKYSPGAEIDLEEGELTLYAQARFDADIQIAVSFMKDGERYFMTQPGAAAPRFARARHFGDWTNVKQGMSDAYNSNPNYLSTFSMVSICRSCDKDERGLDATRDTMHVGSDSLVYYETYSPNANDYLGLYYAEPYTILANNTWGGMFKSTGGWPDDRHPYISSTKLRSAHYVEFITPEPPYYIPVRVHDQDAAHQYVQYKPATDQFDGVEDEDDGTEFQLSGVAVADAHYVILEDTTDSTEEWKDEIVFDYHTDERTQETVWSRLIGKQLMAFMIIGSDTIHFHPNDHKTLTTAEALRLSTDYRLTETFSYIRDARVEVPEGDKVQMREAGNGFARIIESGANSPMDVQAGGNYTDIYDTLRIALRPTGTSKIKAYYGRWKDGAAGLKKGTDGSRYHDIIVRTKTYHYSPEETKLVLAPTQESYEFSPLKDQSKQIQFTLTKVTSKWLLDSEGNRVREYVRESKVVTSELALGPGYCSLSGAHFTVTDASGQHVTIQTKADNNSGVNTDTLTITMNIRVDEVGYDVTARVPLAQEPLEGNELIWSVVDNGERYFITAGSDSLIFRQYSLRNNNVYYQKNTWTQLIKGSADAANSNVRYITPWSFTYAPDGGQAKQQLTLKTEAPVSRYFHINGETPDVSASDSSLLTYAYAAVNVNSNANFEEQVRIKYGADKWLKFTVTAGVPSLSLQDDSTSATVFSWGYLLREYSLMNFGAYPDHERGEFGYNSTTPVTIQTRYKAYREYSMLLDNTVCYCCREEERSVPNLKNPKGDWKIDYNIRLVSDSRFADHASGLSISTNESDLKTTITPSGTSPTGFVNIVDTLDVSLIPLEGAPQYRFKEGWSSFKSIEDAHLKIPLVRKTYHTEEFDSLVCVVADDEYNYTFPSTLSENENDNKHTFTLITERHQGTHVLNTDNRSVESSSTKTVVDGMDLTSVANAEVRLVDEYGNIPSWCRMTGKTANTITVQCTANGIRAPRTAYIYLAYLVMVDDKPRFVNFRLTVSQPSQFHYSGKQQLIHTKGASGDSLVNGMQQVHENKRILYYYPDQRVELPVRERNFYGWWRWFNLTPGSEDQDIADEYWVAPPRNTGKYNYPYRIIGDSVDDGKGGKKLVTQGRYTVFRYPSRNYESKPDPPAKSPLVVPPTGKKTITYAVELSNYTDNLPLSMKYVNQIDTARLDTMKDIIEPTLSLREIFELRPWTEMAAQMENYKSPATGPFENENYMEDHEIMAPTGNRLLLNTEQRYNYDNLRKGGHSESLLGYYMRDDNWETGGWSDARKDTMIWVAGWDAEALWYTYDPKTKTYTSCSHRVTEGDDFLDVPAKSNIAEGREADTVYYCLRARSKKTTTLGTLENPDPDEPDSGDYYFNICRWKVIYHRPAKYGPMQENKVGGVDKAIITNDEIEQNYEVLEYLDFDYNKPGSEYQVYPHPLPWADATYGYSYPKTPALPDNRYHNDFAENFPNVGEYGIINRIPYSNYWHMMEQHGGAENGYMIYCDGMSSSGQVAALTLKTHLCEGQKMYFSGYIGNPSSQSGKALPNFLFSVQGSKDGNTWTDITSYMTGDIQPSNKWSQIYFPIDQKGDYDEYRVRIYNMASNFNGNDFIIDDMRIFASKPPLIAYQANTTCMETGENDSITHVVLRVDYQGFHDETFNNQNIYYTVEKVDKNKDTSFVALMDHYINEDTKDHIAPSTVDTIYGVVRMPGRSYTPQHEDSIFTNLTDLVKKFEDSYEAHEEDGSKPIYRQGYIYENIDGVIRPVMYIIHKAKMTPENGYVVRMSDTYNNMTSSICAMTSRLKVSNRMMLELNGEEQDTKEVIGMCANTTYDVSLRVKGSLIRDSIAPVDINGSCMNDWLLYGDTTEAGSLAKYGYKYEDIEKVLTQILRCVPNGTTNANQHARTLTEISSVEMERIRSWEGVELSDGVTAYEVVSDLVNSELLSLYKSKITTTVTSGDSVQYMIFPIIGTGSDAMLDMEVEVCPEPVFVKLKPAEGGGVPMMVGGFSRSASDAPAVVVADGRTANSAITIPVDSIMRTVAIHSVTLLSTNDPSYREGVHHVNLEPDRTYNLNADNPDYYEKGDNIVLRRGAGTNYDMKPGYSYTFGFVMMTYSGSLTIAGSDCEVGMVPFTVSVVPDYLRWDPKSVDNNQWNDPSNWIGINQHNLPIYADAHFVPLATTNVVIPTLAAGLPYPEVPSSISSGDSVKQTGFQYNKCDKIRFMPGTALGQQQNLTCGDVIVDMSMPYNQWAFRSAPVTGMLSGDVFMSDADLTWQTSPWEVGPFDARGRSVTTGNASFWLSLYNSAAMHRGNGVDVSDSAYTAAAEWTRVTNGMKQSLPPAQGWAVYARTASGKEAAVRLPKNDDMYYYYTAAGEKLLNAYEQGLRSTRSEAAGGTAGQLAYQPAGGYADYTLRNAVSSSLFVFGNPSMGYIDIWGFIEDNSRLLSPAFDYMAAGNAYTTVTSEATSGENVITNIQRYLPPMHAIVLKAKSAGTSLTLRLNTSRVVTAAVSPSPASAPALRRAAAGGPAKGIMTVTAVNPVSSRCVSRLLIGQGYHADIREGEDAMLTTVNIDHYTNTSAPATPFNLYASEGGYGLSIDLRDEVMNVPLSFYMSDLPFDPVTHLWFTGVNNIDGQLVLYDAVTGSEQAIVDGICLDIETPVVSHEKRYYIRRAGYQPGETSTPVATDNGGWRTANGEGERAQKILRNEQVLIIHDGHVYTMFGQKIR